MEQHSVVFPEKAQQRPRDLKVGLYFIQKAFCVISSYPFFEEFDSLISDVRIASNQGKIPVPLEEYIAHFLFGIPAPPRENYKLVFPTFCISHMNKQQIDFKRPCEKKLPYGNT